MNQNKTRPTSASVHSYIQKITPEQKQLDCRTLDSMMERITKNKATLWGSSIIGYGSYHYKYKSGREGDWFLCGFAARKQAITIYLLCDLEHPNLDFTDLGTYKKSVGCLYLKRLSDIDLQKLEKLIRKAVEIGQKNALTSS